MQDAGLNFGVLGPLSMSADGRSVALGAPKQRAVFAMLLLNRGHAVSVDALISAVWDESPAPAARTAMQSYISNLRGILANAGVDRQLLASAPPGYRLDIADTATDLGRFAAGKMVGVQSAAAGRFADASTELTAALAEWRGPVLADLRDFPFVGPFATVLDEERLQAETARAEAEIACGRADSVLVSLEQMVEQNPYREPLWAQLITAYYVCDRQSDALAALRRLTATLADDLGVDPGPTISELQQRILRQESLDVRGSASATAIRTMSHFTSGTGESTRALGALRDAAGRIYPLDAAATRIGRLADNDIVLGADDVSRNHAVVIDDGGGFTIVDLRSANGVIVDGHRIRSSARLFNGSRIQIGRHEFICQIGAGEQM